MIFKGFSEKSKIKYLNRLLSERHVNVSDNKMQSLGVLVNIDEFKDLEQFKILTNELSIRSNSLKIITFSTYIDENYHVGEPVFNLKDFGWKGNIKNMDLQTFIEQEFDVLISYYRVDVLELKLITALSKAQFKIGISNNDTRVNDLIIQTGVNDFNVFKSEMFKYLTILNKIT
jgi:hypothetical protein